MCVLSKEDTVDSVSTTNDSCSLQESAAAHRAPSRGALGVDLTRGNLSVEGLVCYYIETDNMP